MEALVPFNIPVSGLGEGAHSFDFQIDSAFFECFEASPIKDGKVILRVIFDKRPDLYVLDFDIKGTVKTTCDRCLEIFDLPIESRQSLMVKFDEKEHEEAEIIYVLKGRRAINIAKYIYEFINLAMPMVKTHDDADQKCNEEIINYLENQNGDETSIENPIWEALKNFKQN